MATAAKPTAVSAQATLSSTWFGTNTAKTKCSGCEMASAIAEVGGDPTAFPGQPSRWLVIPNYAELSWLWTASELVNGVVYLACLASFIVRYRRGDEMLRRQLLWLALALIAMLVALVVWVPSIEAGPLALILLVMPLVPAAITIAVLR
jgi:hypothetical protein